MPCKRCLIAAVDSFFIYELTVSSINSMVTKKHYCLNYFKSKMFRLYQSRTRMDDGARYNAPLSSLSNTFYAAYNFTWVHINIVRYLDVSFNVISGAGPFNDVTCYIRHVCRMSPLPILREKTMRYKFGKNFLSVHVIAKQQHWYEEAIIVLHFCKKTGCRQAARARKGR